MHTPRTNHKRNAALIGGAAIVMAFLPGLNLLRTPKGIPLDLNASSTEISTHTSYKVTVKLRKVSPEGFPASQQNFIPIDKGLVAPSEVPLHYYVSTEDDGKGILFKSTSLLPTIERLTVYGKFSPHNENAEYSLVMNVTHREKPEL